MATQVLLATAISSLVIFSIAAALSYQASSRRIERDVSHTFGAIAQAQARAAGLWFDGRRMLVESADEDVATLPPGQTPDKAFVHQMLLNSFLGTYYGSAETGAFYNYPRIRALPPGYDPRKRPWFRQAVAHGRAILTAPYRDASLAQDVVTIATPHWRGGRIVGVTGADFSIDSLVRMLDTDKPAHAYVMIVGKDGTVLVHPDSRFVGAPISRVFDGQTLPIGGTWSDASIAGKPMLVTFARIPGLPAANWYVGVVADRSAALGELRASVWTGIALNAAMLIAALLTIWAVLSGLILRPLKRVTDSMDDIVAGRETQLPAGIMARSDEVGGIARAVSVFEADRSRVIELTHAEVDRLAGEAQERAERMASLRALFGRVVHAATAGDFSLRVPERFEDHEINALAHSVNALLKTMDEGLNETGVVLSALSRTDLTVRARGDFKGAFAKLQRDANAVADRFTAIIHELHDTSQRLDAATATLKVETEDLAGRTDRQSGAIRSASTAIAGLSQTVTQNAGLTQAASVRAHDTARSAQAGSAVLKEARAAMTRMNASSATIFDVMRIIDEVVSQTGLLALNASIEAARAGAAGRGFAVVASEIQSLAHRASQASDQAKHLVDQTRSDLDSGSRLMSDVTDTLAKMLEAGQESATTLRDIAAANHVQARAIEQIGAMVAQIDDVAADNGDLVDRLNRTTIETGTRAAELDQIVETFTVARR